jgi:hypothetical protein
MRSTSFVLVVMACYSPHVHEGSPCTTDDGCPSGQMCFDNVCTSSDPSCQCSGSALACAGGNEPCALGCVDTPEPHCALVAPSNRVDPASASGLTSTITIDGSAVFDGDTGTVTGVDGAVPYSLAGSIAVFSFHGLAITQNGSVRLAGSHPIAFLVDGDAMIDGVIDGGAGCGSGDRGCPGPGGGIGGTLGSAAGGCGAGGSGETTAPLGTAPDGGGGGGGAGGVGGAGGAVTLNGSNTTGGTGGASCIASALEPIEGGGGGGGGGPGAALEQPRGGGGGGAFQLTAMGTVTIGGTIGVPGGGGDGGTAGTGSGGAAAGAGGGAGGAVLIEATAVTITGTIAANGGGGGGGGVNTMVGLPGEDGRLDAMPAAGGSGAGTSGSGAAGGAGSADAAAGASVSGSVNAGGGGGAFGRVFIRAATLVMTSATLSPSAGTDTPHTR